MSKFLQIQGLKFSYNSAPLIENFSLSLEKGEVHCLLGPSGCGKSTILHLISGFMNPTNGEISLEGQPLFKEGQVNEDKVNLPTEKRSVGIVFQEHCLFPHLSVIDNIKFGMKNKSDNEHAEELLELVGLAHKKYCLPDELSGGEQQRIAIIRTLATRPKIFLMDEPFSGLDQDLRTSLRREIIRIVKKLKLTTIIVTHSQEEALELADRITVVEKDHNYQTGSFTELIEKPLTPSIANFMNSGFFLNEKGENSPTYIPFSSLKISNEKNDINDQKAKVVNIYKGRYTSTYCLSFDKIPNLNIQLNSNYFVSKLKVGQEVYFDFGSIENKIIFKK